MGFGTPTPKERRTESNHRVVAFSASPELLTALRDAAKRHGFPSAALYVRALVLDTMQRPETEIAMARIADIQRKAGFRIAAKCIEAAQLLTVEDILGPE